MRRRSCATGVKAARSESWQKPLDEVRGILQNLWKFR